MRPFGAMLISAWKRSPAAGAMAVGSLQRVRSSALADVKYTCAKAPRISGKMA